MSNSVLANANLMLASLIVIMWSSLAFGEARVLDEAELDMVTAGGPLIEGAPTTSTGAVGSQGSSAYSQDIIAYRPSDISSPGYSYSSVENDGDSGDRGEVYKAKKERVASEVAVAGDSSAVVESSNSIELSGEAQSQITALTVTNTSGGATANAVNLWRSKGGTAGAGQYAMTVGQSNRVSEDVSGGAALYGFLMGRSARESVKRTFEALNSSSFKSSNVGLMRSIDSSSVERVATVSVKNPHLEIPSSIEPDPITFDFSVNRTVRFPDPFPLPGGDYTDFGFNFGVSGAVLDIPSIDLTGPKITATDVQLTLPSIDLGTLHISRGGSGCAKKDGCINEDVSLGTISGRTVSLGHPVDLVDNPFYTATVDIPVGLGFAGYGTGSLGIQGELSNRLQLFVDLDLSKLLSGLSLDLAGLLPDDVKNKLPLIGENLDQAIAYPSLAQFFPSKEFAPVLYNQKTVYNNTYEITDSGTQGLCLGDNTVCSGKKTEKKVKETRTITESSVMASVSASESYGSEEKRSDESAVSISSAGAEFIVAGNSSLEARTKDSVGLGGTAQESLRASAAVNSTRAVVANGLNIAGTGRLALPLYGAGSKLTQGNHFIQSR